MLTKDDLKAIAETVHPLIKAEGDLIRKETRQVIGEAISKNNKILGQIIRIELASQKQEIVKAVKMSFQDIVKVIRRHDEQIKEHDKRVTKLEKQNLL